MKQIKKLLLFLIGIVVHTTAGAETVEFSLAQGASSMYGTSLRETYDVAILVDCPSLRGAKVKGLEVAVPSGAVLTDANGWLSNTLRLKSSGSRKVNDPDIIRTDGTVVDGRLSVSFAEPYTVTDTPFYAGYSFTVSGDDADSKKPVSVVSDGPFRELWMHTSRKYASWTDVGSETGLCSTLTLILDVDRRSQALSLSLPDKLYVAEGSNEINCLASNFGTEPVESFAYTYQIGGTTGHGEANVSVMAGAYPERSDVKLKLESLPVPGTFPFEIKITEVNGKPNMDVAPEAVSNMCVMPFVPEPRPLVEEYTGLWCGYCPAGYVTIEEMKESHPDTFVALAYHVDDVMGCIPSSQFQSSPGGLPKAFVNRGEGVNPLDIPALWSNARSLHVPAEMDVKLDWIDETHESVRATSTIRFVEDMDGVDLRVAYVLVGDGLKDAGWSQSNYYSGQTEEHTGKWWDLFTHGGSRVTGLEFNDVVLKSPKPEGIPQSVPSEVNIDEPVTGTFVFRLTDIVNLKGNALPVLPDKVRCVAILIDGKSGKPVTSATSAYPGQSMLVSSPEITRNIVKTEWRDMLGRLIGNPSGLCIRTDYYDDGTHRSVKQIIK